MRFSEDELRIGELRPFPSANRLGPSSFVSGVLYSDGACELSDTIDAFDATDATDCSDVTDEWKPDLTLVLSSSRATVTGTKSCLRVGGEAAKYEISIYIVTV